LVAGGEKGAFDFGEGKGVLEVLAQGGGISGQELQDCGTQFILKK